MAKNTERRATNDRRNDEVGPPAGWKERRRSVERRKPDVEEVTLDEWQTITRQRAMAAQEKKEAEQIAATAKGP